MLFHDLAQPQVCKGMPQPESVWDLLLFTFRDDALATLAVAAKQDMYRSHRLTREFCGLAEDLLDRNDVNNPEWLEQWVAKIRPTYSDEERARRLHKPLQDEYADIVADIVPTADSEMAIRNHTQRLARSIIAHLSKLFDSLKLFVLRKTLQVPLEHPWERSAPIPCSCGGSTTGPRTPSSPPPPLRAVSGHSWLPKVDA